MLACVRACVLALALFFKQGFLDGAPDGARSGHHGGGVAHRLQALGGLEHGARQGPCGDGARGVVLASEGVDGGVDDVVAQCQDARVVAQEGPALGDVVQHGVQLQLGRAVGRDVLQALHHPGKTPGTQPEQVHGPGAVAQVIGPPTGRDQALGALERGQLLLLQVQVLHALVEARQGMQPGAVDVESAGTRYYVVDVRLEAQALLERQLLGLACVASRVSGWRVVSGKPRHVYVIFGRSSSVGGALWIRAI